MIGQRHTFADGYSFVETLHGPNVETACASCGDRVYATPEHVRDQLCSTCGRRRWGAPVVVGGARARRPTGVGFPSALGSSGPVEAPRAVGPPSLVERWPVDDARLPTGPRRAVRALQRSGRHVGVLHTVAFVAGKVDERISVQSPGGIFLCWQRRGSTWTATALLNAWRGQPVKMGLTRAMEIINGEERS